MPWRRAWQPTAVLLPGETPWTEEPGRLQSMGSQRVRHDWVTKHPHNLFILENLHTYFLSHFSHQGNMKKQYLWNTPVLWRIHVTCLRNEGSWGILSWGCSGNRVIIIWPPWPRQCLCVGLEVRKCAKPCNMQASWRTGSLFRIPQKLWTSVILVPDEFLCVSALSLTTHMYHLLFEFFCSSCFAFPYNVLYGMSYIWHICVCMTYMSYVTYM